jgi:hypothetical protein
VVSDVGSKGRSDLSPAACPSCVAQLMPSFVYVIVGTSTSPFGRGQPSLAGQSMLTRRQEPSAHDSSSFQVRAPWAGSSGDSSRTALWQRQRAPPPGACCRCRSLWGVDATLRAKKYVHRRGAHRGEPILPVEPEELLDAALSHHSSDDVYNVPSHVTASSASSRAERITGPPAALMSASLLRRGRRSAS